MSAVAPADSTYNYIANKVRRLTGSSSQSSLSDTILGQYVNNFVNQNFPNAIKTDQMRAVYTFYTAPNIDQYPVDVNYWQGFRYPIYVDGYQGIFYKDRQQFYNLFPKWPTLTQPASGNGTQQAFSFKIGQVPFLRESVTLGCVSTTGLAMQVSDDGQGNLIYNSPNPRVSVPLGSSNPAYAGMYNLNTRNPGLNNPTIIGTVDYVTGTFAFDYNLAPGSPIPAAGESLRLFVSVYQTARPYAILFWNNYIQVRPVPKLVHKIEIEAYQTPIQFLLTSSNPIMNQWAKYIAFGTAIDIQTDRSDMASVGNLMPGFKEQADLVLERQATEEIGQRNSTIFCSTVQGQGNFYGSWGPWY
jgi:hypothetical protein